jgi:nitrite reductase/ring-hydroxylating ferredoxin subunit
MDAIEWQPDKPILRANEFRLNDLAPGQITFVYFEDEKVAVYNVEGKFYATQDRCSHTGWPLSDGGELSGHHVTCPLHNWCYDITTGEVIRGIRSLRLRTFRIIIDGDFAHVEACDAAV